MRFSRLYRIAGMAFSSFLFLIGNAGTISAQPPALQNSGPVNPQGMNPRHPQQKEMQELIEALYISRLQEDLKLSNEQFAAVIPAVKNFLQVRQEGARRKHQTEVELNQLLDSGAPDEQVQAKMKELDQVKKQNEQVLEEATKGIDSKLDVRQQARFRQYQQKTDQHINRMIQEVRQGRQMQRMQGRGQFQQNAPRPSGPPPTAKRAPNRK
ncbi:MAG: hypothetical protein PHX83_08190 [Acidobacteriia bacterium]|nr:hypothetical protein [Terriglobia bacterium]